MNHTSGLSSLVFVCASVAAGPVIAQTLLQPGEPTTFTLAAGQFTNDIAIDVPEDVQQLRVDLQGPEGIDAELLLRYGEAFPVEGNAGVFGGVEWLYEHAHYRSASLGADESIVVTRRQIQPLREGRWYLSVLNLAEVPAQLQLQATFADEPPGEVPITVDFDDEASCAEFDASSVPWFDDTPMPAVGGNTGKTLGEQRRNAFNHALGGIRSQLDGPAPIHILACWTSLGGDNQSAVLASAGPVTIMRDDVAAGSRSTTLPFLPKAYTWYVSAAVSQLAGTEQCGHSGGDCNRPDVFIEFNSDVDEGSILGGRRFHYGYGVTPGLGTGSIDFVSTAMHEITHGLGFVGLLNLYEKSGRVGGKFRVCYEDGWCERMGHDDAYSDATAYVHDDAVERLNAMNDARRAEALTSGTGLRWYDAAAVKSPANPLRFQDTPGNLPPLYAPPLIAPGSTLSHLDTTLSGELMRPFLTAGARDLGLAAPMLAAVGWQQADARIPTFAQPYGGQWFDPVHSGHSIDLHRVEDSPDTYMMVLNTFDEQGLPEWYLSIGRVVDGVFRPGNDANGNSLWRTRYLFGPPPEEEADTSVPGQVRIDFNQASRAPECNDGENRGEPLALMHFSLGNDEMNWCLTPLVPQSDRPSPDRSGHWSAGTDDAGWGITTLAHDENGLFVVLHYPDSEGRPRWAVAQTDNFQSGAPMTLQQVRGYCRTCSEPPDDIPSVPVGEVTLMLDDPEGGDERISFEVRFDGPGDGRFTRVDAPLIRIAESAPAE